jgi:predicted PhzF superfamily epimerase YddE/YHI9
MNDIVLKRIDVFTTTPFAGNPAGVVLHADDLDGRTMQSLAAQMKMNLIETAFVSGSRKAGTDFRVRFFTPDKELEMSGHVMIGACFALIEEGMIDLSEGLTRTVFETRMGNISLEIYFRSDYESGNATDFDGTGIFIRAGGRRNGILERIMMLQPVYRFIPCDIPLGELAGVLGVDPSEISNTGLPVVRASNEIDWLIIPVKSKETICGMRPDLIKLGILNRKYNTFGNHVFSLDTFDSSCITYSRNFSPAMGLWEDPASASGSSGLGTYLRHFGITSSGSMVMQQGNEKDNLARILVEIEGEAGRDDVVKVGGLAVTSIQRKLELAPAETV